MDKMTPMDPEYQETPPEWQPGTPGYYGTGRLPKPPRSHTGLIVVLLCVMIVANVITVLMLLTLRMRAVQKNTTVGAETETDVTPTLTAPSGHSVEPTEPRTNGTGTLQISAEDTQTRSAGEIYTAMRPSLALVYADGNGGTAIVMTADGYLITNAHTVSGAESITVQLSDGMEYAAALSGMDESSDLAVLKIEPETALQPAEFGDSAGAAAGDTVYMFSHPFGAAFDNATMTDGSIAAVQSGVRIGAETLNVFQTDAAPDSGSAGGPLVNEAGQVIGICIDHVGSYVSYQTVPELGFAIPISEAKTILDDLIVQRLCQRARFARTDGLGDPGDLPALLGPAERRRHRVGHGGQQRLLCGPARGRRDLPAGRRRRHEPQRLPQHSQRLPCRRRAARIYLP